MICKNLREITQWINFHCVIYQKERLHIIPQYHENSSFLPLSYIAFSKRLFLCLNWFKYQSKHQTKRAQFQLGQHLFEFCRLDSSTELHISISFFLFFTASVDFSKEENHFKFVIWNSWTSFSSVNERRSELSIFKKWAICAASGKIHSQTFDS